MRLVASCVLTLLFVGCSSGQTDSTSSPLSAESNSENGGQGGSKSGGSSDTSPGGCTYTQGYWKNHASAWPVTSLTIGGVVYSQQQLLALFDTSPGGDASLILAHQLIAALLNVANGAVPSATVQQAINDAQAWMTANKGSNAALPYGVPAGSAAGNQATALTDTLDSFNSGTAGTPHCGQGGSSSSSGSGGGSGGGSGSSCGCSSSSSGSVSGSSGGSSSGSSSGGGCVGSGGACTTSSECCAGSACNSGTCQQIIH
jgi:hypothetical protein